MSMIPVVLLCGGRGIYLDDSGQRRSKGLVKIAGTEMFLHVIRLYARSGFRLFILCVGDQAEDYRRTLAAASSTTEEKQNTFALAIEGQPCTVQVMDTGEDATTGTRINRIKALVAASPWFCVTYSDTLCGADLKQLADFHLREGKIATLISTRVPTRFRILGIREGENLVRVLAGKSVIQKDHINGGFYCFTKKIFEPAYLGAKEEIILEETVLDSLAQNQQLIAWYYEGPWQHLDSERDLARLEALLTQSLPVVKT